MEHRIVVYQTFSEPILANLMLGKLKDAGFECFLSGEQVVNLGFLFDSPLAEISLHIFERDVEEVALLLNTESK